MKSTNAPANIDDYISQFPGDVQQMLMQMRTTIQLAAPQATEAISYGIPTFRLNGNLVHFAAYQHHIGFYPGPAAIEAFLDELTHYKCAKGTVQFPLHQPLPLSLIRDMVSFRAMQNLSVKK